MKWLIGLVAFIPIAAHASQNSILCKTTDTNEYIDIVSKGSNTNDVLFQIQGGTFYDGVSSFENPILKVIVPFDEGSAILIYNTTTQKGGVVLSFPNERQNHEIRCTFR